MKTLYRQFIVATLCMLAVSVGVAFLLANLYYVRVTKAETDQQHAELAQEIARVLEVVQGAEGGIDAYLASVAKFGYQIYVLDEEGQAVLYGDDFDDASLPEEALRVLTHGETYHGIHDFSGNNFMVSHFANELKNTVGVPFTHEGRKYGLFIRQNVQMFSSDIHTVLFGFIFAVALVNVLGMFWLARRLTRPITRLTEATKQIARENYDFPLNIRRKDEIGQLSESFRAMQTQLRRNDLARKAFINNVSHDFQSPLMNIQGYAELLQAAEVSAEERLAYASVIDLEARRLSGLTRQLLLLTSLDQEAYPMKRERIELDDQIRQTVRRFRWRLEEGGTDLSFELEPAVIWGDRELLDNVWENLLTNAIKYNRPGGRIHIRLAKTDGHVTVTFRDTGIGIPPEALPHLFERFFRVDEARKSGGSGLGLSIVQHIVSLHDGDIQVDSRMGEGSTFVVRLPDSGPMQDEEGHPQEA